MENTGKLCLNLNSIEKFHFVFLCLTFIGQFFFILKIKFNIGHLGPFCEIGHSSNPGGGAKLSLQLFFFCKFLPTALRTMKISEFQFSSFLQSRINCFLPGGRLNQFQ